MLFLRACWPSAPLVAAPTAANKKPQNCFERQHNKEAVPLSCDTFDVSQIGNLCSLSRSADGRRQGSVEPHCRICKLVDARTRFGGREMRSRMPEAWARYGTFRYYAPYSRLRNPRRRGKHRLTRTCCQRTPCRSPHGGWLTPHLQNRHETGEPEVS